MVNQRRKAERAAAMSFERDNGGSSPIPPDFWDEVEAESQHDETERSYSDNQPAQPVAGPSTFQTPPRQTSRQPIYRSDPQPSYTTNNMTTDEELWAMEAARAEEAEREAEEAEMARLMEEAYHQSPHTATPPQADLDGMDIDMDMGWEMESD